MRNDMPAPSEMVAMAGVIAAGMGALFAAVLAFLLLLSVVEPDLPVSRLLVGLAVSLGVALVGLVTYALARRVGDPS